MICLLELKIAGVAAQRIHENSNNGTFCEKLISESDFKTILANSYCYDYGANASEAVQKIRTRTRECCTPTHQNSYFYNYIYEKANLAVYSLFVGDTSQVSIFFWHI